MLQRALVTLRSHLQERDRLSVCTFTSVQGTVHNFKNMTDATKHLSEEAVRSLPLDNRQRSVSDGFRHAYSLLNNRNARFADVCFLVITDGLMDVGSAEQLELLPPLPRVSTSVIVFDDTHNSAMIQSVVERIGATLISVGASGNLGEALGGALGASMNIVQWSSTLQIALMANIQLRRVHCGEQKCVVVNNVANVDMLPWVDGETRHVLITVKLPQVTQELAQELFRVSLATTNRNGEVTAQDVPCSIKRVSGEVTLPRNVEVDAQVWLCRIFK